MGARGMKGIGIVVVAVALAACGGEESPEPIRFSGPEVDQARNSWAPELVALVDSGNAAYRTGHYDEARRLFTRGTTNHPHNGAVWFGLYMAEHALGNVEAADSALAKAENLTPGFRTGAVEMTGDSAAADAADTSGEGAPGLPRPAGH